MKNTFDFSKKTPSFNQRCPLLLCNYKGYLFLNYESPENFEKQYYNKKTVQ